MKKFTVQKEGKIGELLIKYYEGGLSYGQLMKLFRKKDIKLNGKRVGADCTVKAGDLLEVYYDGSLLNNENVIYLDENILIIDKPSGITSESFFESVSRKYQNAIFTHRLDRNTYGLMIFAFNKTAYDCLFDALKNRTAEKYYYCAVYGVPTPACGIYNDYLLKDEKKSRVKIVSEKQHGALNVKTGYEVVKAGNESSVLKIRLYTGRTHQIRAHLAYHKHFILGDGKYGDDRINRTFGVKSQVLVSAEIIFHFNKDSALYYLNGKSFCVNYDKVFDFVR